MSRVPGGPFIAIHIWRHVLRAARQNFVKSELHRIRKSFMALAKAFDRLGPALTVSVNRAVTASRGRDTFRAAQATPLAGAEAGAEAPGQVHGNNARAEGHVPGAREIDPQDQRHPGGDRRGPEARGT